jgi:hypothetical protein
MAKRKRKMPAARVIAGLPVIRAKPTGYRRWRGNA